MGCKSGQWGVTTCVYRVCVRHDETVLELASGDDRIYYEHTKTYRIVYLKAIKMVNFFSINRS